MRETKRYLGIDLGGAKNQKTSLAALEYYPKEQKIFLLDIYEKIAGHRPPVHGHGPAHGHGHGAAHVAPYSGDEALLELVQELATDYHPGAVLIGVNVPLDLPPCIGCTRKSCPLPAKCTVPAVKWMNAATRKAQRSHAGGGKTLEFTPYTQRPIELWVRYQVLQRLPEPYRFEIDETLGGNKAPLTARMSFLKRHLGHVGLAEVWPKLSVAMLASQIGLDRRAIAGYRHLEQGAHARERILETLADRMGIFIYERDVRKLAHSLSAFDAFVCAYTALLADTGRGAEPPTGFPGSSGWVAYPHLTGGKGRTE